MKKFVNTFIVFLLLVVGGGSFYLLSKPPVPIQLQKETPVQQTTPNDKNAEVLGSYTNKPRIYISGGKEEGGSGGVIALSSLDEPAVQIGSYNSSGNAEIAIYQSSIDDLLNYLTHDKDNKQIKKTFDVSKLNYVATINQQISSGYNSDVKTVLPIGDNGIWLLSVKMNGVTEYSFVLRTNYGILVKQGDNELIFWGQDFKTGESISEGEIKIYNLQDKINELKSATFGSDGIAKIPLVSNIDIAVGKVKDQIALVPMNLQYLNSGYSYYSFQPKIRQTKYFMFTDRPIYKPGDTVNFKTIVRDDDDARYSIPKDTVTVKIYKDFDEKNTIFEKNIQVSEDGTINGDYILPQESKTGYYTIKVSVPNTDQTNYYMSNTISFQVDYYRKPEYSIDVTTPQTQYIQGDQGSFSIFGNYFSGEPLANQKVKYSVYSSDYYEYEYLTDTKYDVSNNYRYGYWGMTDKIIETEVVLGKDGKIDLPLNTKLNKTKPQILSIEAQIDNGSGNPTFARKNILLLPGDFAIYRKSYGASYSQVNTSISLPLVLKPISAVDVNNIPLNVNIHRENWVAYQVPNQKYLSYKKEEEDLPSFSTNSDNSGNAVISFTPSKIGSYKLTVEGKDKRGNTISKVFYWWVSQENYPFYNDSQDNNLTIKTDKDKYVPSDTIRYIISSNNPNRDAFLSLERGRVNRFQIVHLTGATTSVDVPVVDTDIPNIFAKVSSFSTTSLDSNSVNALISADSKKIKIKIDPDKTKYNPSDTSVVNITTTDINDKPVSAELALWAVDKAIFELTDNNLGNIFNTFWAERYDATHDSHSLAGITVLNAEGGGGCFGAGTKILMADKTAENIEDVQVGNEILTLDTNTNKLVKTKVVNTTSADEKGYLIINTNLKVTADHKIWVNNSWQEAGSIQINDKLVNEKGQPVLVSSIEWILGRVKVYNLTTETYHTFFANSILVHNEKGIDRTAFKDTAYWNPSIHTDTNGQAKVSFVLPDNLTTWTISAVASTADTKVGQNTTEIQVAKDIALRPVLPNILRIGDKIVLSAIVQNASDQNQTFNVNLKFDSGDIQSEATQSGITIRSKETKQVYWEVLPKKENDKAKVTFSVVNSGNGKTVDSVINEIPVLVFGFYDKTVEVGSGDKNFLLTLNPKANKEKSDVKLSLASSLINTLPSALDYLIGYPYGCVEQTTSRFVPAILAKENSTFLKDYIEGKNLDNMIKKGILRLQSLQQPDGGWSWWSSGRSDPFVSGYVFEYLVKAKNTGAIVDAEMLKRAQTYLEQEEYYDSKLKSTVRYTSDAAVIKTYALSLTNSLKWKTKITDFSGLSPDLMALAVLANVNNGDKNSQTNGLSTLLSNMKTQGDEVFWEKGDKIRFGSVDVSTALSVRAILASGGDRVVAEKAIRYVNKNRRYDYWSSTFGTVQVLRAIIEFSKNANELTPNYTYTVTQDKVNLKSEQITIPNQKIKDIVIPYKSLKSNTSEIGVSIKGQGQLYSTLIKREFIDDTNAAFVNHGLTITREYISEKGEEYSLSVGDTVTVRLTVNGLLTNENYGIIKDELPSGLVPINTDMKNEQYNQTGTNSYDYYHKIFDREYTQNGVILSLYEISPGQNIYEYKARVVSEGEFIVPPVEVSLMYSPEIFGRSAVQRVKTTKTPEIIPGKALKKTLTNSSQMTKIVIAILLTGIGAFLTVIILIAIGRKRSRKENSIENQKENNKQIPPQNTP